MVSLSPLVVLLVALASGIVAQQNNCPSAVVGTIGGQSMSYNWAEKDVAAATFVCPTSTTPTTEPTFSVHLCGYASSTIKVGNEEVERNWGTYKANSLSVVSGATESFQLSFEDGDETACPTGTHRSLTTTIVCSTAVSAVACTNPVTPTTCGGTLTVTVPSTQCPVGIPGGTPAPSSKVWPNLEVSVTIEDTDIVVVSNGVTSQEWVVDENAWENTEENFLYEGFWLQDEATFDISNLAAASGANSAVIGPVTVAELPMKDQVSVGNVGVTATGDPTRSIALAPSQETQLVIKFDCLESGDYENRFKVTIPVTAGGVTYQAQEFAFLKICGSVPKPPGSISATGLFFLVVFGLLVGGCGAGIIFNYKKRDLEGCDAIPGIDIMRTTWHRLTMCISDRTDGGGWSSTGGSGRPPSAIGLQHTELNAPPSIASVTPVGGGTGYQSY